MRVFDEQAPPDAACSRVMTQHLAGATIALVRVGVPSLLMLSDGRVVEVHGGLFLRSPEPR